MKKVLSMVLVVALLAGILVGVSVQAADSVDPSEKFSDVSDGVWYENTLSLVVEEGIIDGYTDGTFRPDNAMQVDQFIKTMIVALDYTVTWEGGYWAQPYIDQATEIGIVASGDFEDYTEEITRAEMAMICERTIELLEGETNYSLTEDIKLYITDDDEIEATGLEDYVYHMYELGVIKGYTDRTFRPNNSLRRCEAITVVARVIDEDYRSAYDEMTDIERLACYEYDEYDSYMSNEEYIDSLGIAHATQRMNLLKDFMETDNNVNYETIDTESYKEELLYYYSPSSVFTSGRTGEEIVDDWIERIIDDEVHLESTFTTDTSLVYQGSDGTVRVRGTFRYIYYHDNSLREELELNTWYEVDYEVVFSIKLEGSESQLWEHSKTTFSSQTRLSEYQEVEE